MPREFTSAVAGVRFPNADGSNRDFEVLLCVPGEPVELRPEPKNKHDPQAVAVFSARGVQIGYLPAERAPWIGGRIKLGEDIRAVFQARVEHGALIRINMAGEAPTLPAVVAPAARPAAPSRPLPSPSRIDRSDGSQLPEVEPEDWPDYIPPDE